MRGQLPPRLETLYEAYQCFGGNYLLHGPRLTQKWLQIMGSSGTVDDQITRETIRAAWRGANLESDVTRAIFLTMFWGYGSIWFGRRNTRLAIESISDGKCAQLLHIRDQACSDALRALKELSALRIKGLGVAFETKILYGMTGSIPILDRHTRQWFNHHGFDEVDQALTDFIAFDSYFKICSSWASSPIGKGDSVIGDPCLIEYLMFWDAKRGQSRTVKEAPTWLTNTEPWGR